MTVQVERKMQENKDPEKFSLSAFPIDKDRLKTSSVKPKKPKKSHVLHEVEEYSPKLSQISKQIHTTENEHLIDENQQDKLQGISPQQNKTFLHHFLYQINWRKQQVVRIISSIANKCK